MDSINVISERAEAQLASYNNSVAIAKAKEKEWKDKYQESTKIPADSSYLKWTTKYPAISDLKYRFDSSQVNRIYSTDIQVTGLLLENLSLKEAINFCDSVVLSYGKEIDLLNDRVLNLQDINAINTSIIENKDAEIDLHRREATRQRRTKNAIIVAGGSALAATILLAILNNN